MGDTTRRYSVIIDNNSNKDSVTYTETNYDDSRRTTNYTETNTIVIEQQNIRKQKF
ncbi:hypothetical protein LY90DRAFT_705511, partial [Neocallimastix californiae]